MPHTAFQSSSSGSGDVVTRINASGEATIEFTDLDGDSDYELEYNNVNMSVPNLLRLQVSTDNGATWKTTGYNTALYGGSNGGGGAGAGDTVGIRMGNAVNSDKAFGGIFHFGGLAGAMRKHFLGKIHYWSSTSATFSAVSSGCYDGNDVIDAIRCIPAGGGVITAGQFTLRRKSSS